MCATIGNEPIGHHEDTVSIDHARQSMREHNGCPLPGKIIESRLDNAFILSVH
ncbi:hypothetical protein D3C87_1953280 [compost metagenome]